MVSITKKWSVKIEPTSVSFFHEECKFFNDIYMIDNGWAYFTKGNCRHPVPKEVVIKAKLLGAKF